VRHNKGNEVQNIAWYIRLFNFTSWKVM